MSEKKNSSMSIMLDHQYLSSLKQSPSEIQSINSDNTVKTKTKEQDTNELDASTIQQCFQSMLQMTALSDLDSRQQQCITDLYSKKQVCVTDLNSRKPPRVTDLDSRTKPEVADLDSTKQTCVTNLDSRNPPCANKIEDCKIITLQLRFAKSDRKMEQSPTTKQLNAGLNDKDTKSQTESLGNYSPKKEATQDKTPSSDEDEKRQKEWRKLNRDYQEEVRYNALLQHTMSLLVKRWMEYLAFTPEQMYKFELENAQSLDLTDDVMEILQDRDLHVWQIIDMINDV